MKKFCIVLIFMVLVGCNAIKTSKFDNLEYGSYIKLLTMVEEAQPYCTNRSAMNQYASIMKTEAAYLSNYTFYKDFNDDSMRISKIIRNNILQFYERYQGEGSVSEGYCKSKLMILKKGLKSVVEVTASRIEE